MRFLLRLVASAIVIYGVAYVFEGRLLRVASPAAALYAAIALGVVNAVVKPVVKLLTLPLTLVTLGLFSLVLNALFLYGIEAVVPGFRTVGFLQTVLAAAIISVATGILGRLVGR